MPLRNDGSQHRDALDRRLALLGEELAWLRPDPPAALPPGTPRPGAPGSRHGADLSGVAPASPARPWWDEHTRVADRHSGAAPPTPAPTAVGAWSGSGPFPAVSIPAVPAPTVPAPGRHAARRPGPRPLPPEELGPPVGASGPESRGRLATARLLLGPGQLTVVAMVVVLALGVTCWWLARGRPDSTVALQSAPAAGLTRLPATGAAASDAASSAGAGAGANAGVAEVAVGSAPSSGASAATGSAAAEQPVGAADVTVDVAGKVRHPGIQVLAAGARIADALAAAGGARPGVDLTALNLAQVLVDGQQVLVGVAGGRQTSAVSGPTAPSGGSVTGSSGGAGSLAGSSGAVQVVDLNTATADQLDTLPDVGPVTAQSILAWRDAHGGFSSVDELLEVDGIGQVTLGKLAPYVTV